MNDASKYYTGKTAADRAFAGLLAARYGRRGYCDVFHGADAVERTDGHLFIDAIGFQVKFFPGYRRYQHLFFETCRLSSDGSGYLYSGIFAPGRWHQYLIGDQERHWIFPRKPLQDVARRYSEKGWIKATRDERTYFFSLSLSTADRLQEKEGHSWVRQHIGR